MSRKTREESRISPRITLTLTLCGEKATRKSRELGGLVLIATARFSSAAVSAG